MASNPAGRGGGWFSGVPAKTTRSSLSTRTLESSGAAATAASGIGAIPSGRTGGTFGGGPATRTKGALPPVRGRSTITSGTSVPGRNGGGFSGVPAKTIVPSGVTVPSGVARIKPRKSRANVTPGGGGLRGVVILASGSIGSRSGIKMASKRPSSKIDFA